MSQIFNSFYAGGFECSTHRRNSDRQRLDVIASTRHDTHAAQDYRLLQRHGMAAARDGLRWHLIEAERGRYDWSSLTPQLDAARATGMEVMWDLLHYGWPDWTDPYDPDFVSHFAAFAGAAAERIAERAGHPGGGRNYYVPVNEISFLAWGGGEVGYLNPFRTGEGDALKTILARAAIAAIAAIRAADANAVIGCAEPLIRVHSILGLFGRRAARDYNEAQFAAIDMVLGRLAPELGGREDNLDLIGFNYYPANQWWIGGRKVWRWNPLYVPLSELLVEAHRRYGKPMWIAETGCEGKARIPWFNYVADEVERARDRGADVGGICLYPILNHLGWDDDRYCPNGLFCGVEPGGARTVYEPLAEQLARRQPAMQPAE